MKFFILHFYIIVSAPDGAVIGTKDDQAYCLTYVIHMSQWAQECTKLCIGIAVTYFEWFHS